MLLFFLHYANTVQTLLAMLTPWYIYEENVELTNCTVNKGQTFTIEETHLCGSFKREHNEKLFKAMQWMMIIHFALSVMGTFGFVLKTHYRSSACDSWIIKVNTWVTLLMFCVSITLVVIYVSMTSMMDTKNINIYYVGFYNGVFLIISSFMLFVSYVGQFMNPVVKNEEEKPLIPVENIDKPLSETV